MSSSWFQHSLSHLGNCISPEICYGCGVSLPQDNQFACPSCIEKLPYTDFHYLKANPFIDKFFGRIPIYAGASMLYFSKDGIARGLVHDLKYKDRPELGHYMGRHYGHLLSESDLFGKVDLIIPVPLHSNRYAYRGYNQSETFAEGLSSSMGIPMRTGIVSRERETMTQTKKTRVERFKNVDGAFHITTPEPLIGKHILLVDDVLTTGATLEGCAQEIIKVPNVRLNMATIGFAYQ